MSVFLDTENYNLIAETNHTKALSSITSAIYGMTALQIRSICFDGHRRDDINLGGFVDTNLLAECKAKHEETIRYLKTSSDKVIAHLTSFSNGNVLQTDSLLELCYDLVDLAQDAMPIDIGVQIQKRENYKKQFYSLFEQIIRG